jgi:hypothetical protein
MKNSEYTTGHCDNNRRPGGCQLHNVQCGYPQCDRKPVTDIEKLKAIVTELEEMINNFKKD